MMGRIRFSLIFFLVFAGWTFPLKAQSLGPLSETLPVSAPRVLSLDETLGLFSAGTELHWDPLFRTGVFSTGEHKVAFGSGLPGENGPVILDGQDVFVLPLPYMEQGSLRFPETFVSAFKTTLNQPGLLAPFRIAAIVIDPGHGGKDSGAVGTHVINGKTLRLLEKDITLQVSRQLHARLSAAYPDKRILMTRTGDTYPSLEDRVTFAHSIPLAENEAIVFISIHANSSFNAAGRGYEVWYLSPEYRRTVISADRSDDSDVRSILNAMMEEEFTTESIIMAQSILKSFEEYLGRLIPSRGLKAEEWFVVRNARMPSVLVELGFVSNLEDAKLLSDETHLQKFSDALYKGISDFVTLFERSGGFIAVR